MHKHGRPQAGARGCTCTPLDSDLKFFATLCLGMLKSFFLKNRLSFAKNRFFSIIVSDVTVIVAGLPWGLMQLSRWVVERQVYKQTGHADWTDCPSQKSAPGFRFSDSRGEIYLHAKFRQDISIHGWNKTTSVSENRRPPYWNSVSCFDFDFWGKYSYRDDILHLLAKFVVIGRSSAELWRHIDFSRLRS